MNVHKAGLLFFIAALAGALPAAAADWGSSGESYRDVSVPASIPVPAPIPVAEHRPTWYFRLDAGLGIISDPDLSESGFEYGAADAPSTVLGTGPGVPFGMDPAWFTGDFDTLLTLGAGVGYTFGGGWRMDATVEKRSKDDIDGDGTREWDSYGYYDHDGDPLTADFYGPDANANGIVDNRSRIDVREYAKIDGTVWMLNGYYDFAATRTFKPYVGAGIGFVWNEVSRSHTSTTSVCNNEAAGPGGCTDADFAATGTTTVQNKSDTISFAAAAMAGLTYDITDITSIDVGYRFLYLGGTSPTMTIGGQESSLEIGDQFVHQLRAGLRFNVN